MSVLVAITGRDNTKLIAKMQSQLPNIQIEQLDDCQESRLWRGLARYAG